MVCYYCSLSGFLSVRARSGMDIYTGSMVAFHLQTSLRICYLVFNSCWVGYEKLGG